MYDELKKLCSRKNLLLIVCILAANFFILLILAENGMYGRQYAPASYRMVFQEMSGKDSIQKAEYLKEKAENYSDEMTIADFENQKMYQELYQDAEKIGFYDQYISSLESDILQKYEISIFSDLTPFEEKKDEKLLVSYEKLHQVPVVYDPSEG